MQETHSTKSNEKKWQNKWGYKIIFSHGTSNSRGTYIHCKNNFDLEITKFYRDNSYCWCNNWREKVDFENVYAPNNDTPEFFDEVFSVLEAFDGESLVVGSDFHCILKPVLDKKEEGKYKRENSISTFAPNWKAWSSRSMESIEPRYKPYHLAFC